MLASSFLNRIISTSAERSSTTCKFFIRHISQSKIDKLKITSLQQSQGEPTFTFLNLQRSRPGKTKSKKKLIPGKLSVVGYATANEYNLVSLVEKFIEDVSIYFDD